MLYHFKSNTPLTLQHLLRTWDSDFYPILTSTSTRPLLIYFLLFSFSLPKLYHRFKVKDLHDQPISLQSPNPLTTSLHPKTKWPYIHTSILNLHPPQHFQMTSIGYQRRDKHDALAYTSLKEGGLVSWWWVGWSCCHVIVWSAELHSGRRQLEYCVEEDSPGSNVLNYLIARRFMVTW